MSAIDDVLAGSGKYALVNADCVDAMRGMRANSVDAVVCDPPYGLEFMGKDWDSFKGDDWRNSAGMTKPGIGERDIEWPSFGGGDSANATCAACGGRMRGKKKCECAEPDWRVKGETAGVGTNTAMRSYQAWCETWAREALRVLKPGGHLLAFGGTRTYHRLAVAIEEAGFEIRDSIDWFYGSGFPKSLDVGKALDRQAGAAREVVGHVGNDNPETVDRIALDFGGATGKAKNGLKDGFALTAPATDAAKAWNGWGTALKPAHETVVVARKPLIGTVASNVIRHGTGGINVDACRVGFVSDEDEDEAKTKNAHSDFGSGPRENQIFGADRRERGAAGNYDAPGRWPTNVLLSHSPECVPAGERKVRGDARQGGGTRGGGFADVGADSGSSAPCAAGHAGPDGTEVVAEWRCVDGCPVALLDAQSGSVGAGGTFRVVTRDEGREDQSQYRLKATSGTVRDFGDTGTASRFFPTFPGEPPFLYEPKAGRAERNEGCERLPESMAGTWGGDDDDLSDGKKPMLPRRNPHPTVKPVAVMRWLIRLVTPPGGVVLDPFMGSGSCGVAAMDERVRYIGVEKDTEHGYFAICEARVGRSATYPEHQQIDLFGGAA